MTSRVRVFVVDEHPICRRGVASMIEQEPQFEWAGEAADGTELLAAVRLAAPDVVVMDMDASTGDCQATLQALAATSPGVRTVLMAGTTNNVPLARRALALGAGALLLKSATQPELVEAVRCAAGRDSFVAPGWREAMAQRPGDTDPGADLTHRERELLALLARGLGNGDISARLAIAIPTVKFHITNILSKLQAENRTAAVLVALRHNIVHLE